MRCRAATHGVYRVYGCTQCAFADERGFRGLIEVICFCRAARRRPRFLPRGNWTRRRPAEIFADNVVTRQSTKAPEHIFFAFAANQSVTGAF
jgi:hypothetical protein